MRYNVQTVTFVHKQHVSNELAILSYIFFFVYLSFDLYSIWNYTCFSLDIACNS